MDLRGALDSGRAAINQLGAVVKQENVEAVFAEHLDILVTLEIAVEMARKDGRQPNAVARAAWETIRPRVKYYGNLVTFDGVGRAKFPKVPTFCIVMLRNHLDRVLEEK